jgi:SAM-dependent methyltransferase
MTAADNYRARIDAVQAQRDRLVAPSPGTDRWERMAKQFRMDPNRELDPNLAATAGFIEPDDVVLDIGGGAGRMSLPLALRCREVVNVEPSPAMCREFAESAAEGGITNARAVQTGWPAAGISGDVSLVFNVTYFVREIVPFVESLLAASRRRVIIGVWSVPPPNGTAGLFEAAFGEPQEPVPNHEDLVPVLWEMGILPDVRVLPGEFRRGIPPLNTEDDAVRFALDSLEPRDRSTAETRVREAFPRLFRPGDAGFVPAWRRPSREMLITWEAR